MTNSAPLIFEDVEMPGLTAGYLKLEVLAHGATAVIGNEASGVDSLGAFALGLLAPTHGRAVVYGEVVSDMARSRALAFRRKVGYLPAGDGLLQNLSLADNIALPLRFGSDSSEKDILSRVGLVLSMFGLVGAAGLRPSRASDEERRRTALARALAFDPPLVILEELFDGLTPRAAAELLELARGGESAEGSRRTLLITGQYIPERLRPRIEHRYRIARGQLQRDE